MLRWITMFIEENKQNWKERDENRKEEEEKKPEEKQKPEKNDKKQVTNPEERKMERLKQAKKMKEYWKRWRRNSSESSDEDNGEETATAEESEDEGTRHQMIELEEYRSRKGGGRLCLTCILYPCQCMMRKADSRVTDIRRKEEGSQGRKRTRSGTNNKNLFPSVIEEEDRHHHPPPDMPAAKKLRQGHHISQASIEIKNLRPQHQPLVHRGGAGANDVDQPPHHQHLGDGREVGRKEVDEINKGRWNM